MYSEHFAQKVLVKILFWDELGSILTAFNVLFTLHKYKQRLGLS